MPSGPTALSEVIVPLMLEKTPEVAAFWQRFRRETGTNREDYVVVSFDDSPELADELLSMALRGIKRATASLAIEYSRETLPRVDDLVVVVDGAGQPKCVWQTTDIVIKPLNQVDAAFAWDEGEGDRTVGVWLDNHRAYFSRQCRRNGWTFKDDMPVVFERFEIIYRT